MKHQSSELTGRDSEKIRGYRAATVCLVLLLTVVIVLWIQIITQGKNHTEEKQQLLTKITNLTEETHQLLTNNTNLIQQNKQLEKLKKALWNFTQDGWIYYRFSFYYEFNETKNWNESRINCTERRADLLIINSKEKQEFVRKLSCSSVVWFGLTDVEGIWKWVVGSTLTSGFWLVGEHNGRRVRNFATSYSTYWCDARCDLTYKWICEKSISPIILP